MYIAEYGVPLLIALFFSIFLFYLSGISHQLKKKDALVINFSGGLVFAYLFMSLLPDIYSFHVNDVTQMSIRAFIAFIGYIAFYLAEKRIFEHSKKGVNVSKQLLAVRTGGFYVLHFITGYIIVYTFEQNSLIATLAILIPFTFHILATMLLFEDLHSWVKETTETRIVLSVLIVIGAFSAIITQKILTIPHIFFYSFFAGTFIYLVTTLLTPRHKHSHLTFFLLGIFIYFTILLITGH